MKERVPLCGPQPLGVGTPLIESLTSFVGRLAIAHHVPSSAIFDGPVRPLVSEGVVRERLHLSAHLASGAIVYDGLGKPAEDLVYALTRLTGLSDMALHTLLPWRGLLPPRHSGALHWGRKRWCAWCFADWRADGRELWEPLLWRIAAVRRCPVHRTPLSETCPKCAAPQGLVQEIAYFGSCRRCDHDLEVGDRRVGNESMARLDHFVAEWEWWTSLAVGQMLACQLTMSNWANDRGFPSLLNHAAGRDMFGSVRRLVRYVGVDRGSLEAWMKGRRRPSLDSFLAVSMRLRFHPLIVAIYPREGGGSAGLPWEGAEPPWPPIRPKPRRHRRSIPRGPEFWDRVAEQLAAILDGPEPWRRTLTEVAESFGVSPGTVKRRFPAQCVRIQNIREAYKKHRSEQLFIQRREDLRAAVSEFVQEGRYPAMQRVFERAGLSQGFQRVPKYRQIWVEALNEHGITVD